MPNEYAAIWADHDEDCHGTFDSFEDDPRYASGFMWVCCEKSLTDHGCMTTKHKAPDGYVAPAAPSLKRKAEAVVEDELFPRFAQCENCKEEFDVTENIRGECIWHSGRALFLTVVFPH